MHAAVPKHPRAGVQPMGDARICFPYFSARAHQSSPAMFAGRRTEREGRVLLQPDLAGIIPRRDVGGAGLCDDLQRAQLA